MRARLTHSARGPASDAAPSSPGRFVRASLQLKSRLAELEVLAGAKENQRHAAINYKVANADSLGEVVQVLQRQQDGLAKLTQVLKDDMEATAVIARGPSASSSSGNSGNNAT